MLREILSLNPKPKPQIDKKPNTTCPNSFPDNKKQKSTKINTNTNNNFSNNQPKTEKPISDLIIKKQDYSKYQNMESTSPTSNNGNINNAFKDEISPQLNNCNINIKIKNDDSKPPSISNNSNNNVIEPKEKIINNNSIKNLTQENVINNNKIIEPKENIIRDNSNKNLTQGNNSSKSLKNKMRNKSFDANLSIYNLGFCGIDKLKILEEYITQIKEKSVDVNEDKIEQLQKKRDNLQNKVNILSNNIRQYKKKTKDNIDNNKNLEQEKESTKKSSLRANKDEFSLKKELPEIRADIELMKNQIAQSREEAKYINNYAIDLERQTMEIHDEIKKYNGLNSTIKKDKEKIINEINTYKKKCYAMFIKIQQVDKSSNEFLLSVAELVKLTQKNK